MPTDVEALSKRMERFALPPGQRDRSPGWEKREQADLDATTKVLDQLDNEAEAQAKSAARGEKTYEGMVEAELKAANENPAYAEKAQERAMREMTTGPEAMARREKIVADRIARQQGFINDTIKRAESEDWLAGH